MLDWPCLSTGQGETRVPEQTVLVLGCGITGVMAARELRRQLPQHRVVVLDKAPRAAYAPSFAAVAVSEVRGRSILRPRARLARLGIEFVNAEAHHIDLGNKTVRAESRELRYDYLVLALGAEPRPDLIPGLADSAQGFFSFEAAERLAASLRYFAGGRVLVVAPEGAAGWAAAPYEIGMLLEHYFHERKMRQKVEIAILTPEEGPLGRFGHDVSDMIAGQLAHKGIEFGKRAELAAVDSGRHLARFVDGAERGFELLVTVPPGRAPAPVVEAGLAGDDGRIAVDLGTLETGSDSVFAAGDVALVSARDGLAAPQSLDLSRRQAIMVARQIAARIGGGNPPGPLAGKARWFVEVGAGAGTMISGDFLREPGAARIAQPSIVWHWVKAVQEKQWLYRWY